MFTFEDLEKAVTEAKSKGVSPTDVVAFTGRLDDGNNIIFIVKNTEVHPEETSGGTFWLYGTEY